MTVEKHILIQSDNEKLATTIAIADNDAAPILLRISGGYISGHRPNDWQQFLAKRGITSVAFDFPGVGASAGDLNATNLDIRLEHSQNVYTYIKNHIAHNAPVYILGVSMGGPIAIHMTQDIDSAGLLLCVCAAYPKDAWSKNFGEPFSYAIRREYAWQDSDEFAILSQLSCPIFFGSARNDEIIPQSITEKYRNIVQEIRQVYRVYDAPHAFLRLESEASAEKMRFWSDVAEFIHSNSSVAPDDINEHT